MTPVDIFENILIAGLICICCFPILVIVSAHVRYEVSKKARSARLAKRDEENPGCIFDEFAEYMGKKPGEPVDCTQEEFAKWAEHIRN